MVIILLQGKNRKGFHKNNVEALGFNKNI